MKTFSWAVKKTICFNAMISFALLFTYVWLFKNYLEIPQLTPNNWLLLGAIFLTGIGLLWLSNQSRTFTLVRLISKRLQQLKPRSLHSAIALTLGLGILLFYSGTAAFSRELALIPFKFIPLLWFLGILAIEIAVILSRLSRSDANVNLFLIALNALFFSFLVWVPRANRIVIADDSPLYFGGDSLGYLFSSELWSGFQPFGLPLIYTLIGNEVTSLALLHHFLHAVSWSFLAWAVARHLQSNYAQILSFSLILVFSLVPQIHAWNVIALTESLRFSLFAIVLGLVLLRREIKDKVFYPFFLSIGTLWAALHYGNTIALLVVFPITIVLAISAREKPRLLFLSFFTLALIIGSFQLMQRNDRQVYNLTRSMFTTVLPYPDRLNFFQNHGMPDIGSPSNKNYLANLSLESDYQIWARDNLQSTYAKLLLHELPGSLLEPFQATFFPTWYSGHNLWGDVDYVPLLDRGLTKVIEFKTWSNLRILLFSLSGVMALISFKKTRSEIATLAIILSFSSLPIFILTWHSDAGELERHSLFAGIQFKLAFVLAWAAGIDTISGLLNKKLSSRVKEN